MKCKHESTYLDGTPRIKSKTSWFHTPPITETEIPEIITVVYAKMCNDCGEMIGEKEYGYERK